MEFLILMKDGIFDLDEGWNFIGLVKHRIFDLDEGWNF